MEVYIMIFNIIPTLSYDISVIQYIVPCNKYDITSRYFTLFFITCNVMINAMTTMQSIDFEGIYFHSKYIIFHGKYSLLYEIHEFA